MIKRSEDVIIVHNARDEDEIQELQQIFKQAAQASCKKGEMVVIIINFNHAPIIPMHLFSSSEVMTTEEALKAVREELDFPDTTFSGAAYIERNTGKHPRELLKEVVDRELANF